MGEAKRKAGQIFNVRVSQEDRFQLAVFLFNRASAKEREERKRMRRAMDALDMREFKARIVDDAPKISGINLTPEETTALRRSISLDPEERAAPARDFELTIENIETLGNLLNKVDHTGRAIVTLCELVDDLLDLKDSPPEHDGPIAVGDAPAVPRLAAPAEPATVATLPPAAEA